MWKPVRRSFEKRTELEGRATTSPHFFKLEVTNTLPVPPLKCNLPCENTNLIDNNWSNSFAYGETGVYCDKQCHYDQWQTIWRERAQGQHTLSEAVDHPKVWQLTLVDSSLIIWHCKLYTVVCTHSFVDLPSDQSHFTVSPLFIVTILFLTSSWRSSLITSGLMRWT